ncbi:MAG: hypothetical protein KGQ41_06930, partial [Alphaproteobacteria bacterium]|nr:hypothetical protein [Alphaproteobacteria bacterium]
MKLRFLALTLLSALAFSSGAIAQSAGKDFATTAFAIDGKTLQGVNMTITLIGIDLPTGNAASIENALARAALDDAIGSKPVRCMPMGQGPNGTTRAQCLNAQERDLALYLLTSGLVTVKRGELMGSDLANAYSSAERSARASKQGIWGINNAAVPVTGDAPSDFGMDFGMGIPMIVIMGAMLVVPLLGFLIMALIMHSGFRQLITLQKYQLAGTQKRERQLKEREKYVIASAIEAEINTNRAKLDAFLTIYEELLKSLRDPSKKPKYQRAGDIIHEKPALARTV